MCDRYSLGLLWVCFQDVLLGEDSGVVHRTVLLAFSVSVSDSHGS